jgi:hypothetical protein
MAPVRHMAQALLSREPSRTTLTSHIPQPPVSRGKGDMQRQGARNAPSTHAVAAKKAAARLPPTQWRQGEGR